MRLLDLAPSSRSLLGLLAALPAVTGCMTVDLWGGYYFPSARDPETPVANAPEVKLDASWGVGVGVTAFYDHDQKLRVGPTAGAEYVSVKGEGVGSEEGYTSAMVGVRGDYQISGGDTKLMASVAGALGKGEVFGTRISHTSAWLGASAAWYEDGDSYDAVYLGAGLRYIGGAQKGTEAGDRGITIFGPEVRLSFPISFMGSAEAGGGGGGGGGDGQYAKKVTLPDGSNVIPPLAGAMRKKGCSIVELASNAVIGDCWNGRIGYIQEGNEVIIACGKSVSGSACEDMNRALADEAAR